MTLRIFAAALGAEVNSFSPLPIDRARFAELWLHPAGTLSPDTDPPLIAAPLRRAWALAAAGEAVVTQGLCAGAQPGGIIARATWTALRDELLADLAAAGPVDIVLLGLHGATVADGQEDCEAELMARVRAIVGPAVTIAALLDPHCHLSPAMLALADVMIAYKEYPHDDIFATADRLVDLAVARARQQIRPVMRAWDCRTIGVFNTYRQPMRALVDDLNAAVAADPRVLDISVAHGFPWGDVPDMATRVWVTTDDDADSAAALAEAFGRRIEAIRDACQPVLATAADAIALVADGSPPLVLAETADNPGGGAPGDATHLVSALIAAGVEGITAGIFWDPVAVMLCEAAGVGAVLPLRIGGGASRLSGDPLDLEVRVIGITDDLRQPFGGSEWPGGKAVCVAGGGVTLVLSAVRTQCFAVEAFTSFGIDLAAMRVVVVKSSNHFEASFRGLSDRIIIVATPGALTPDPRLLPYRRVTRPIWPLDGAVAGGPLLPAA